MGLDNTTLFIANITILLVSLLACSGVWLRSRTDTFWLIWIAGTLALAVALSLYVALPELSPALAIWPDGLLILGMSLRIIALRRFGGRVGPALAWIMLPLVFGGVALALVTHSLNYGLANLLLTLQMLVMAVELWRQRGDRLPSRLGLTAVTLLMAASFAARAGQGFFAADQIVTYIPFDALLELHLVVALVYVAASSLLVLSLASERAAGDLARAAFHDSLTGLPNRRAFEQHLQQAIAGAPEMPFALCLIDIDRFKKVNDRHGHAAGDAVLRHTAEVLRAEMIAGDHLARIGGEEFALILPRATPDEALAAIEQLRRAVADAAIPVSGQLLQVTVCAGFAHSSITPANADILVGAADRGLYQSKQTGRNRTSGPTSARQPAWPDPECGPAARLVSQVA